MVQNNDDWVDADDSWEDVTDSQGFQESVPQTNLKARYEAKDPGVSLSPDTQMGAGAMAGYSALEGATGMDANQAADFGLKQALRDKSINQEQFTQMSQQMQQEDASGNSFSQQLASKQAENPAIAAMSYLGGAGAAMAAEAPAFNAVTGAAFSVGKEALQGLSQAIASKIIPLSEKAAAKIGGIEGVKKLGQVMDEVGLTTWPRNLGRFAKKVGAVVDDVGQKLGLSYKKLDKATEAAYSGDEVIRASYANWLDDFKAANNGAEPSTSMMKETMNNLHDWIDPKKLYNHTTIGSQATAMQKNAWRQSLNAEGGFAKASGDPKLGFAVRRANLELAEKAGVAPEVVAEVRELSSAYNKLKVTERAAQAKLDKSSGATKFVTDLLIYKVGGPVAGGVRVASDVAKSTLGKTTAAAVTKLGSRLLGSAADMGRFGKVMLQVASKQGYQGLVDWHVNMLQSSPAYADSYMLVNESSSQNTD